MGMRDSLFFFFIMGIRGTQRVRKQKHLTSIACHKFLEIEKQVSFEKIEMVVSQKRNTKEEILIWVLGSYKLKYNIVNDISSL